MKILISKIGVLTASWSVALQLLHLNSLASAVAAKHSSAQVSQPLVKHEWLQIPEGWEMHDLPPEDHPIHLKIALKQGRIDELISTLYEVSDPFHENYGRYLSRM